MSKKTYTVSVVGGGCGGRLSLDGAKASSRFRVAAVADLRAETREKLKQDYPDVKVFASHEDMFAECPTDVVCVSTFPPSHEDVTMAALKLPLKGIVVEKPLSDTYRGGQAILSAIQAKKLPMMVPHGLVVRKHSEEILARVKAGEIGPLRMAEIEISRWDIMNAGIHWMHFFMMLRENEPIDFVQTSCDAATRTFRDGMQVETEAVTLAQTKSGVRAYLHTGDALKILPDGRSTVYRLIGENGWIEFYGWDSVYRIVSKEFPGGKQFDVAPHPGPGHVRILERLAEQMDSGAPDYTVATASLMALEICEAAYVSARHRCKVAFPLAKFAPPKPADWDPGKPYSGTGGGRDGRKL